MSIRLSNGTGLRHGLSRLLPARTGDVDVAEAVTGIQSELKRLRKLIVLPTGDGRIEILDQAFLDVSERAAARTGKSLQTDRRWILWQAVRNAAPAGGAAADLGPQRYGTADFIAEAFEAVLGTGVPVDAIETLEGVRTALPSLHDRRYGLVRIDLALDETTLECLRDVHSLLVSGGVILLEDYGSPGRRGVRLGADAFLGETDLFQPWHLHTQQLALLRRG
jgi:hypothetical protein